MPAPPSTGVSAPPARGSRAARRGLAATVRAAWPSVLALALLAVVLVRLAFDQGGYFPPAYLSAGIAAFAGLAVLVLLHRGAWTLSVSALVALASLTLLAAWTGLSSAWSETPDTAVEEMQRGVAYVGLLGLALVAGGSGRPARLALWTALGVCLAVAGAGLLSRLYPDSVGGGAQLDVFRQFRLAYPLGYWNAFGAMAAMGGVLALGLAADPRGHVVGRALASGAAVLLAVAMYFSLSRASWLALIAGVVALLALGAHRGSLLLTGGVVGSGVLLALLRLRGYPELVDGPGPGDDLAGAGRAYAAQLATLTGLVMAAVAVLAAGRRSEQAMHAVRRVGRPVGAAVLAVAAIGALGAYAIDASRVEGRAASMLDGASDWVDEQWDEFLAPVQFTEAGTARLTTAKGTRSELYRVAIDGFESNPLWGDGAGAFEVRWYRTREVPEIVRDAHSLELETLGELGLVGAVLLLGLLGSIGAAVVRSRVAPGALTRAQAAAAGGALTVWLVHSFVDWDWQMPAVTGTMLLIAAAVLPVGRRVERRRRSGPFAA